MTNLSEVMDIFSNILTKSRFGQQPIPGNFSPRPNPKKNTTKGTKPTSLTKEFKPVPGTYAYRRDPSSTAKPKGKTAGRELISDGATSDDATFVEGLEKARILKAFGVPDEEKDRKDQRVRLPKGGGAQSGKQYRNKGTIRGGSRRPASDFNANTGSRTGDIGKRGGISATSRGGYPSKGRKQDQREANLAAFISKPQTKEDTKESMKRTYGEYPNIQNMQKAHMLKAFGVRKSTGGRHSLHPVERRPKTVTEKADGGEKYSSGARGKTSNYGLLGMIKALADGMSPERKKRIMDRLGNAASRYDEFSKKPENPKKSPQKELPFSTEDRDNIAPTPDPHGDTLSEPTQRGGGKQGSTRKGSIPREGWKEAALLYPAHRKDQQGGRKVKTRVGDSPTGYPT